MKDRLIELINQAELDCLEFSKIHPYEKSLTDFIADTILADGWMRPPCKVGDVVKCDAIYYEVYRAQTYSDFETPIHHRYWANPINDDGEDDFWFWSDKIEEETVIVCSKEEAEKALQGVKG